MSSVTFCSQYACSVSMVYAIASRSRPVAHNDEIPVPIFSKLPDIDEGEFTFLSHHPRLMMKKKRILCMKKWMLIYFRC